jgi:ankyrin repeat protein
LFWELPTDRAKGLIEEKDVNAPDSFGSYMLTVACQRLHVDTVRLLLAAGADPNVRSESGDTPLLCTIDSVQDNPAASMSIVEILVAADADLERRGYMNKTPFLKACSLRQSVTFEARCVRSRQSNSSHARSAATLSRSVSCKRWVCCSLTSHGSRRFLSV